MQTKINEQKPRSAEIILSETSRTQIRSIVLHDILTKQIQTEMILSELERLQIEGRNDLKDDIDKAFLYACRAGLDKVAIECITKYAANVNAVNSIDNNTPLLYALINQNEELANLLREKGGDLKARNNQGQTPLLLACRHNYTGLALNLIDEDIVNLADAQRNTPIHEACEHRNIEVVKALIGHGANVNPQEHGGKSLLLNVMSKTSSLDVENKERRITLSEILILAGAEVNLKNEFNHTPLSIACKRHEFDLAELLLEKGAEPNVSNIQDRFTPLLYATAAGNESLTEKLIAKRATVCLQINPYKYDYNLDPFYWAYIRQNRDMELLLSKAKIKEQIPFITPFERKCINESLDRSMIEVLESIDYSNIGECVIINVPKIHSIAQPASSDIVRHEPESSEGITTISYQTRILNFVLKLCPERLYNSINNNGETRFHRAIRDGDTVQVRSLLTRGVNIDAQTTTGTTALHLAISSDKPDLVRLLKLHKAKINIADINGDTPLHLACRAGNVAMIELLIELNADVNITNNKGEKPRLPLLATSCDISDTNMLPTNICIPGQIIISSLALQMKDNQTEGIIEPINSNRQGTYNESLNGKHQDLVPVSGTIISPLLGSYDEEKAHSYS